MEVLYCISPVTASGKVNMEVDRRLMEISEREGRNFFRFYRWEPACISLGRGQDPEDLLDTDYMRSMGYDWVNRITGGSYVLHKGDITYSITASSKSSMFKLPLMDFYKLVHRAFYLGILKTGIDSSMITYGNSRFAREHKKSPCFSHFSNNEILIEGRKILGSAQKRGKNGLLQHGSLLVDDSLYDLYRIQKVFDDFDAIEKSITYIRKYADISYEELYSHITESVCDVFGLKYLSAELKEVLENIP